MNVKYLKIRAKRKDNGEWVEGYYLFDSDKKRHYIVIDFYTYDCSNRYKKMECNTVIKVEIDPETICRLVYKDNEKEIWENDIVSLKVVFDKVKDGVIYYNEYGIVKWEKDKFIVKSDKSHLYYKNGNYIWEWFTVEGNIFDNPELLKEV